MEAIKSREKTGIEIPCPLCGTKIKPRCPFYAFCAYRLSDIGNPRLCISHPEMCDFFKSQGGISKMNVEVNPSRRDELDYEPI
jgi:hypothetical protein